jgi:hydrogenase expression/formation protein HypC
MCLAVPGKIISIDNADNKLKYAKVSFGGAFKNICIEWVPEAMPGDYIVAHAGIALNIINSEEAEKTLEIFDEWVDGLNRQDKQTL